MINFTKSSYHRSLIISFYKSINIFTSRILDRTSPYVNLYLLFPLYIHITRLHKTRREVDEIKFVCVYHESVVDVLAAESDSKRKRRREREREKDPDFIFVDELGTGPIRLNIYHLFFSPSFSHLLLLVFVGNGIVPSSRNRRKSTTGIYPFTLIWIKIIPKCERSEYTWICLV